MKKILASIVVIAAIASVGYLGTQALFSDTETSTGNTFTTGTIDIAVDDLNPWEVQESFALTDMKPSYTDYIDFVVYNAGDNPLNLWKTLEEFDTYDIDYPESEEGDVSIHNVDDWINYDMKVELYNGDPDDNGILVWWETIYTDNDNVKIGDLENEKMYLGMIPVGWYMRVTQSYHMVTEAGNEYQSDGMTFDIELYAEQLTNTLILENKEEVAFEGLSHTILGDGRYAELTYKVMDDEFAYTLNVFGMPDGEYTLIKYDDPLDGADYWPAPNSLALANVTVLSGTGSTAGSIDLNQDMINAKIWLIRETHVPGSLTGDLSWSPNTTLFETGLMDYYDSL